MKDYMCPQCKEPFSEHLLSNSMFGGMRLWRFNFYQGGSPPEEGAKVLCDIKETEFYKQLVIQLEEGTAVVNTQPTRYAPDIRAEQVNIGHWTFPSLELMRLSYKKK